MEEKTNARESFERELDSVIFRSVPRDVFSFLREQEEKRILTLYAGTYSLEMAKEMCRSCERATFYFYLNGYNYGYALHYFQGKFRLERDEGIFFKDHKKSYAKKALSNYKIDKSDMRSGEYYAKKKSLIKGEISEGLFEIVLYIVAFAIGTGVLALFGLSDCDTDGELSAAIGIAVIVVIALVIIGIYNLIEKHKKK